MAARAVDRAAVLDVVLELVRKRAPPRRSGSPPTGRGADRGLAGGQAMPGLIDSHDVEQQCRCRRDGRAHRGSASGSARATWCPRGTACTCRNSRAKKRTIRQQAATMSVVSSITTIAPSRASNRPVDGRLVERQVEVLVEEPRRRRAAGDERLHVRPSRMPPQYSGASISIRNVVTPFGHLEHPGPVDMARHGEHPHARSTSAAPMSWNDWPTR